MEIDTSFYGRVIWLPGTTPCPNPRHNNELQDADPLPRHSFNLASIADVRIVLGELVEVRQPASGGRGRKKGELTVTG